MLSGSGSLVCQWLAKVRSTCHHGNKMQLSLFKDWDPTTEIAVPFAKHPETQRQRRLTGTCPSAFTQMLASSSKPPQSYTAYAMVLTKYCLNHCARTCCSLHIVTRCRFTNWPIRCEQGSRNMHFLSINLISSCRSRGILIWLWLSWRGRWTAPVDSEIQRKMCEMLGISALKGYQVEALEAVCLNKCNTLACADRKQKLCVFQSRPNPHHDRPRHCQRASSLIHSICDWPDSYRFEKRPPVMLQRSQVSSNAVAVR